MLKELVNEGWLVWSQLTFELSGRQRQDARPGPKKVYRVPPARAWRPAVGAPLERGVRPRCAGLSASAVFVETNFRCLKAYSCPTVRAASSGGRSALATARDCSMGSSTYWRQAHRPTGNKYSRHSASRQGCTVARSQLTVHQ
jgi:hypothetical protein